MALVEITPVNMTANNAPSPYVASDTSHIEGFEAWKAFDGNDNSGWITLPATTTGIIEIDLGAAHDKITWFSITTLIGANSPATWTLEESAEELFWLTMDIRADETAWSAGETRLYQVNQSSFGTNRYIRLNVTANDGGTNLNIASLHLFTGSPDAPTAKAGVIGSRLARVIGG